MKVEVGKFYKDSQGRRVEILKIIDEPDEYPVIGLVKHSVTVDYYSSEGLNSFGPHLISEWREPIKIVVEKKIYGLSDDSIVFDGYDIFTEEQKKQLYQTKVRVTIEEIE